MQKGIRIWDLGFWTWVWGLGLGVYGPGSGVLGAHRDCIRLAFKSWPF